VGGERHRPVPEGLEGETGGVSVMKPMPTMSDAKFDAALAQAIDEIYRASTVKV